MSGRGGWSSVAISISCRPRTPRKVCAPAPGFLHRCSRLEGQLFATSCRLSSNNSNFGTTSDSHFLKVSNEKHPFRFGFDKKSFQTSSDSSVLLWI